MKTRLKGATILAAAKAWGYTGGDDPTAALAFCVEQEGTFEVNGKSVAATDCELDAETTTTKTPKTFPVPAAKGADEPAADIIAKAKSALVDEFIKAGVIEKAGTGFKPVQVADVSNVKPAAKSMYEVLQKAGKAKFSTYENALAWKHWISALSCRAMGNHERAQTETKKFNDLSERVWGKAANASNSPTGGAALVHEGFAPDLIRIVLDCGVADKLARSIEMTESKVYLKRRTGGVTMSYIGQASTATETNPTYDNVTLDAQTGIVYTTASLQMLDDSGLSFSDLVFEEMAYDIARSKDAALLIGDSSATYGGQTGFERKYGVTATDGGYVVVGGGTATAHTAANINTAIGRMLPLGYRNPFITCTPTIKAEIFDRLADSTPGGLTLGELTGFGLVQRWKGIPIITNNVMSSVIDAGSTARAGFTAGDQIDFLMGDFSLASKIGNYKGVSLEADTSVGFANYTIAFRGVVRFNTVVHDVGTSTTAGPVVSFWQT